MSPPPTSIDGTDITGATIDGQDVEEITVDGQTVFSSGPSAFYHLGGFDGSAEVKTILEYDPATDSITTQAATLPTALRVATGGVIDGKFYHLGGLDGSGAVNTIFEYDPATDSITTQAATLPTVLREATGGAI